MNMNVGEFRESCVLRVHYVRLPHSVKVIVGGDIVLIVTGQPELVTIALMDKVPQFLRTQGLERDGGKGGGL